MAEPQTLSHQSLSATTLKPWKASRWTEAGQILALAEMEAANETPVVMPPQEYAAALFGAGLLEDSLKFTIHALPALEAATMACYCAREVSHLEQRFLKALEAAEAWVANPSEKRRRAAFDIAETLGFRSAASFAALSVFWSGGSIAPEGLPPVPAPRGLFGKATYAAAMLAIGSGGHIEGPMRLQRYLAWAKSMAEGNEVKAS